MKIIFLGSPLFSVNVLKQLLSDGNHTVLAAVCQPDKKGNRNKMTSCEVKKFAIDNGIPVFDWENINDHVEKLKSIGSDVLVTAAYGQMLSQNVLNVAKYGVINVHGSLLPKLRGASPVQRAVMEGWNETGVTIVKSVLKMDAGPYLSQAKVEILPTDTADSVFDKMAVVGGRLLAETLTELEEGRATYTEQDLNEVTFCKKIKAQEEKIDWTQPANVVSARIRGLSSNPSAYTYFGGKRFKVFNCVLADGNQSDKRAGEITYTKKQLLVTCGDGNTLSLTDVQAAEGKRMRAADFLNGLKARPDAFSDEEGL